MIFSSQFAMKLPLVDCYSCVLYYFLLKNTFQCTYSSYTILLLIMFYTLVFCTETACIPPARRPKSPSAAGLLPYRILEESAW